MKPVIAPFARPLYCMRIECIGGTIVRLVEYPYDVQMGAALYKSDTGYQFSGVESGTTFSPGAIDLKSFLGLSPEITLPNIQAGIFDHAKVFVFATDWADPEEDEEPILKGYFGRVTIEDERYMTEVMSLIDLLSTTVGDSYSAACPKLFGGQEHGGCHVDAVALQVSGMLTSVTDNYIFADSTRAEVDDYFGAGKVWFTTGPNAGVPVQRIKSYTAAGGIIECSEPFPFTPTVGDAYMLEPGCRKRQEQDCRDKYDNAIRFGGFKYVPGTRFLNKVGGV